MYTYYADENHVESRDKDLYQLSLLKKNHVSETTKETFILKLRIIAQIFVSTFIITM